MVEAPAAPSANANAKIEAPKEKKTRATKGYIPFNLFAGMEEEIEFRLKWCFLFSQMITEVISTLKEKTGSSQFKISKFIGAKCKAVLLGIYEKLPLVKLCRLSKNRKLTNVKVS